jgi:hypothetical protein
LNLCQLGDEQNDFGADLELAPRFKPESVARYVGDHHVERTAVAFDQHRLAAQGDPRLTLRVAADSNFLFIPISGSLTHRDASAFARPDNRARFDHWVGMVSTPPAPVPRPSRQSNVDQLTAG